MPHTIADDVSLISAKLIEAFDLVFECQTGDVDEPLIRWLDYRLRYIDPQPRQVVKSKDFDRRVPAETQDALSAFIDLAQRGGDLNPYQTKTIKRNDTSGTKRQLRTDGLWADWGVHHAHLTDVPVPAGAEFSSRSEWLLFFVALPNEIGLIDVRSHSEADIFQAVDLVEKAIRSWPEFASAFQLKGVLGLAKSPSTNPADVKELRRAGVTQMLEVDGLVYMPPGLGMTSAATSTQVSLAANRVRQYGRELEKALGSPDSPLMKAAKDAGVSTPCLSLRVQPAGRLSVVCEQARIEMKFPSPPLPGDVRADLERLLLPPWAGVELAIYLQSTSS